MGEGQDTEVAVGLEPVWGRGLNDLVPEKARDVVQLEPDEADPPVVRRVPVVHCQPQAGPRGWENNLFAPRVYSISSSTSTGRKKMWAGIVHMVDICHILVHIPLHLFSIRSVLMEGLSAHIHQC